jgi:hypothetical protein
MTVTTVEHEVATTMGPMISVGTKEPWVILRAMIVVGITVRLEDVTAINVHIALEAVVLSRLRSCRSPIAFSPRGVQALPKPKRLALMAKRRDPMAGC